ncbi:hypothetical protein VaNZ11_003702 [Volvox africanus]|uniref:Cilium assembly protein DZIP1 N-terminal domain-containing protein n=1 Tax=Volvox africanus TaxID=51714 RepID=A0ABQ5RWA3_9CHLO|nr:hypothetical protein VaNZ11_003702 [Volvox africanus]
MLTGSSHMPYCLGALLSFGHCLVFTQLGERRAGACPKCSTLFVRGQGIWSASWGTSREWGPAHRRPWSCDHHRPRMQTLAKASKRGFSDLHDPWREEERRRALMRYVQEVQPHSVTQFAEQTHPMVIQAMRQTVLNVVGSLPPQYFSVRISTMAESLAQLMLSIMTTGYMLRSAQFRLELQKSLKQLPARSTAAAASSSTAAAAEVPPAAALTPALAFSLTGQGAGGEAMEPSSSGLTAQETAGPGAAFLYDGKGSPYAPGVQKKDVEGEVLRWHLARGEVERLAVADYIELLEGEVSALRAQVSRSVASVPESWSPSVFPEPLATAGAVEVLGPETESTSNSTDMTYPGQGLACVSPLPGFGERVGAGLTHGGSGGLSAAATGNAAAPATMGCGGIPLVVGSPLGLPRNELLDYLHGLQASGPGGGFKELACSPNTASGQAVKEAMEMFVARLMGTLDPAALTKEAAEFNSVELSKVLFWLMAVGYTLKSIEVGLDMDDGMGGSTPGMDGGRSPGPNGGLGFGGGLNGGGGGGSARKRDRKGLFGGLRGLLPGF